MKKPFIKAEGKFHTGGISVECSVTQSLRGGDKEIDAI